MINLVAQSFGRADLGKQMDGYLGTLTLPLDMILRPRFGSQYYSWTQAMASVMAYKFALLVAALMTAALNELYFHKHYHWTAYTTVFWMLALWGAVGYTVHRVARMVTHPEQEQDSQSDGPGLSIFRRLPHGNSWAWVRMVWEPLAVSLTATTLTLLGLIPYFFLPFLYVCCFALFMRAAVTYWNGWRYCRDMLDQINHAPVIQAIADGAEPPEKLGRTLFTSIPATTPPAQRKAIAMKMVGLTPEMEALMERR